MLQPCSFAHCNQYVGQAGTETVKGLITKSVQLEGRNEVDNFPISLIVSMIEEAYNWLENGIS